jgi:hypothetical protein
VQAFNSNLDPMYRKMPLVTESYTSVLIQSILYFIKEGEREIALMLHHILTIKFHSSMMHILFPKFCADDAWKIALEKISMKHLYKQKGDIPSSILYLSEIIFEKYLPKMKNIDDFTLIRWVYEVRHRIAQSAKSFAELCHKITIEKKSGVIDSPEEVEARDIQLVADKVSMSMCTFGQIDNIALEKAINRSGIRREIAKQIVTELSDETYRNNIKFLLVLINRLHDRLKELCTDNKRNIIIRKIMVGTKVGNYSPKNQIIELVDSLESNYRYKTINQDQIVLFVSNYVLIYTANKIC